MWGCEKMAGLPRLVISIVLVGLAGCVNGGIDERSRVRWEPRREREGDMEGERPGETLGDVWSNICDGVVCFSDDGKADDVENVMRFIQ
jgi:hypothetical protein